MGRAADISGVHALANVRRIHADPRGSGAAKGRLLALATSGGWTSVALLGQGSRGLESESLAEPSGADQSMRLLAMIGELLGAPRHLSSSAGQGMATVGAIAFDAGPGAFTGLRIGCAVAQGLGFAAALPLVPVGSLEAAAWRRLRQAGGREAIVLVANDARMSELYVALCLVRAPENAGEGPSIRVLVAPRVERLRPAPRDLSRAAIEEQHPELAAMPWLLAGDAWRDVALDDSWPALAQAAGEPARGRDVPGGGDARSVAELGWALWRNGHTIDAEEAAPGYVRDKVALDVDEQRQLREDRLAAIADRGPV